MPVNCDRDPGAYKSRRGRRSRQRVEEQDKRERERRHYTTATTYKLRLYTAATSSIMQWKKKQINEKEEGMMKKRMKITQQFGYQFGHACASEEVE